MRKFDPSPVFFKREWNRNWPFLVGFAITGALITKFTAGFTDLQDVSLRNCCCLVMSQKVVDHPSYAIDKGEDLNEQEFCCTWAGIRRSKWYIGTTWAWDK